MGIPFPTDPVGETQRVCHPIRDTLLSQPNPLPHLRGVQGFAVYKGPRMPSHSSYTVAQGWARPVMQMGCLLHRAQPIPLPNHTLTH